MFQIKYGIAGGYGGCGDWEDCDAKTLEDAEQQAYYAACQEYESYGVFDYDSAKEEVLEALGPDAKQSDIEEYIADLENEDMQSWVDFAVRVIPEV